MLKILFVEDEEKIRDACVRYLKLKGHQVREAMNGQQAVTMAIKEPFDLVVMDVKMPKLDGLSACQQIRQSAPSTRVLLVTGYSATGDLEQVLQDGVVQCLRKPFTFEALSAVVDAMTQSESEEPDADASNGTA